jgi:hypothetical protein
MSWQKVLLVLAATMFVASPAYATLVFYDDFEDGDDWGLIGSGIVPVGSWSLNGGTTGNSMMAYWETTHGGLPDSSVFGGRRYGATIRGMVDVPAGAFTNVDAQFAAQSSPSDLVRLEAEIYGQNSGNTACDLQLSFLSGATVANSVVISSSGISVGGSATGLTWGLGAWHHVTMDYSPTASTFTLAVDAQTPLTGLAMTAPSAVDGVRFVQISAGKDRWSCFDNVSVTTMPIPEPSSIILLVSAVVGLLAYAWKSRR